MKKQGTTMLENTVGKYSIEKGIPVPNGHGRPIKYPLGIMETGDSFFAPKAKLGCISGCIYHARRGTKKKFTMRTLTENGVKGVRVWRIA